MQVAMLTLLVAGLADAECFGAEPTLARLSFWVSPERMTEFEVAYEQNVAPLLARHGLVESSRKARTAR